MNKLIGIVCLTAGAVLLVWGHNVAQAVNSQVKNLFTGSPTDQAMYLYIGGAVLCAVGVSSWFGPGNSAARRLEFNLVPP